MVLQDIHIDYQSTIYSITIDTNEDQVKQHELKSDLNQPIENKFSGG
jgi:hypothetical protein